MKFLNEIEVQNLSEPYDVLTLEVVEEFTKFSSSLEDKDRTVGLLKKIVNNIVNNPSIDKYQSINTNSSMVQKLARDMEPFLQYLKDIGFEETDKENRLKFNGSMERLTLLAKKLI